MKKISRLKRLCAAFACSAAFTPAAAQDTAQTAPRAFGPQLSEARPAKPANGNAYRIDPNLNPPAPPVEKGCRLRFAPVRIKYKCRY